MNIHDTPRLISRRDQERREELEFTVAKRIALSIDAGQMRRASVDGRAVNYQGYKDQDGRMWVIGDTLADIQNPDAWILLKTGEHPMREVFGDFTVMRG